MTSEGDTGLMIPITGGHYSIIPIPSPQIGDKCLIYPSHSGEYYLLNIASDLQPGKTVIIVPDGKGNYWPISSKSSSIIVTPIDDGGTSETIPIIVAGDGTGNYNCDGIDDHVEINQALLYAGQNPGTVIHLKGPFTYTIDDTLLFYPNTTLEGDSTAIITIKDLNNWPAEKPMMAQKDPDTTPAGYITIRGFEIDGNADGNQPADPDYERRGDGFHNMMYFYYADVEVYEMYLHNSLGDGLKIKYSNSVKFHDNIVYDLGHDVVYADESNGILYYNNNVKTMTNSAIRFLNSNGKTYDNTIWTIYGPDAGGPGIQIQYTRESGDPDPMTDIEIYNNLIYDTYGPGIWLVGTGATYEAYEASGVHIHHNVFYGCGTHPSYLWLGGIVTSGFYNTLIEYNTFDSCYNAAIAYMYPSGVTPAGDTTPYTATVQYNIITNMLQRKATPAGTGNAIQNNYPASASFTVENNCCYGNAGDNYVNATSTGDVLADPLYVDQVNHDYHLQVGSPAEGLGAL